MLDDEPSVAQLIADVLSDEGYTVSICLDAREALERIARTWFDVIVSDFKMPNMDGAAFFQALKAFAPDQSMRVGFITGDSMGAQVGQFLREADRPYIEKPIIKHELLGLVDRCLPTEATSS